MSTLVKNGLSDRHGGSRLRRCRVRGHRRGRFAPERRAVITAIQCQLASVQVGLTDSNIMSGAASPTHAHGSERTVMRDPNARAA